jgi:hypothetical protein
MRGNILRGKCLVATARQFGASGLLGGRWGEGGAGRLSFLDIDNPPVSP